MTGPQPKVTRERRRWGPIAATVGVGYFAIGVIFGALAGDAGSVVALKAWRVAAYVVCLVLFVVHVYFDDLRFRRALTTARHTSIAVAFGGFLLAASATLRAMLVEGSPRRMWVALVAWPLLTGVPAFVAAFALAWFLARSRNNQPA
jgi:hypothetical protein